MSQHQNWAAYFYSEPYQHVMRNIPGIKDPAALLSGFRFDYARAGRRGWNQCSMFSGPDRGYYAVHPEELYELFGLVTVPR